MAFLRWLLHDIQKNMQTNYIFMELIIKTAELSTKTAELSINTAELILCRGININSAA